MNPWQMSGLQSLPNQPSKDVQHKPQQDQQSKTHQAKCQQKLKVAEQHPVRN